MTENFTTRRYNEIGLPATMSPGQRQAWEDHLAGKSVPFRLLPKNGDRCTEPTIGSSSECGFPLLIDGSCANASEHGKPEVLVPIGPLRYLAASLTNSYVAAKRAAGEQLTKILDELEEEAR